MIEAESDVEIVGEAVGALKLASGVPIDVQRAIDTIETSDIALMRDSLPALAQSLRLARRTVAVMRQNIAIALVTVGMLLLGVLLGGVTMSLGMLVHEVEIGDRPRPGSDRALLAEGHPTLTALRGICEAGEAA